MRSTESKTAAMANTYTQCFFHIVFSPKNREALIGRSWKDNLERYLTACIQNRKHKLLAINAQRDHVHILIGYYLSDLIPDLVENIKTASTQWINENNLCPHKFLWQKGYGAFTHSKSQVNEVIQYILNQDEHHKRRSFKEEYLELLRRNDVEYDERYIFDFFE